MKIECHKITSILDELIIEIDERIMAIDERQKKPNCYEQEMATLECARANYILAIVGIQGLEMLAEILKWEKK